MYITWLHEFFLSFRIRQLFTEVSCSIHFFVDYDALRALDSDNAPAAPSMSEEEINALPVHKYKVQSYHTAPSGPQR